MSPFQLEPEVFLADAVGRPGARAFHLQARGDFGTLSFLVEKEQVALLADKLREVLLLIDAEDTVRGASPGRDPVLAIEEPVDPEWRVGAIGLAYDEDKEQVVVYLQPVSETPEGDGEEDLPDGDEDEPGVRFLLRRDQARAFVLHSIAVVGEGRAICQMCGLPMDPDGHRCPAVNGHHPAGA